MNPIKETLLGGYYYATLPYRQWQLRSAGARGVAPITVVVFHRVADDHPNGWTTPTDFFCEAIRWLKPRFDLISLAEAQRRLRIGRNHRPSVCITFDDGYASNCDVALPLLLREGIPCTYFVVAQPVLEGTYFHHDTAIGNRHPINTVSELRDLAREGIEIGAHSRTHADLGQIARHERLWDEIVTSRDDLQAALKTSIRYFAFPYGAPINLSKAGFHMAREAGFAGVCSAYGGYNMPGDDPFHLQRHGVDDSRMRVRNWTTVDPLRRTLPRFEYEDLHWVRPADPAETDSDALLGDSAAARREPPATLCANRPSPGLETVVPESPL